MKKDENKNTIELFVLPEQDDYYNIGHPLKTKHGFVRPFKVKELPRISRWIELLKMQSWEVKNLIKKEIKGMVIEESIKNDLDSYTLFQCIQNNVAQLKVMYGEIFQSIFPYDYTADFFYKNIDSQAEFDDLRRLILAFNRIDYRESNINEEIEAWNKKEAWLKAKSGKVVDFDAIHTTLCATGNKPHDVNDFTLCQFYGEFKRIEFFKMYDTTTLYKTVDSKDNVKVVEWYKSLREKEEEVLYDREDLKTVNPFLRNSKAK